MDEGSDEGNEEGLLLDGVLVGVAVVGGKVSIVGTLLGEDVVRNDEGEPVGFGDVLEGENVGAVEGVTVGKEVGPAENAGIVVEWIVGDVDGHEVGNEGKNSDVGKTDGLDESNKFGLWD